MRRNDSNLKLSVHNEPRKSENGLRKPEPKLRLELLEHDELQRKPEHVKREKKRRSKPLKRKSERKKK